MNTQIKSLVLAAATTAAALLAAAPAGATSIVYNQPVNPALSGGTYFFSFQSPDSTGIEVADRFTLTQPTTIEALGWAGSWAVYNANQPVQNINGWKIRFYSSSGANTPGFLANPLIQLSVSDVPSTSLGTTNIFPDLVNEQHFGYSADLADFTLPAGEYFLSVQAVLRINQKDATGAQLSSLFFWDHSTPNVDDACVGRDIGSLTWSPAAGDRAFTILGTPIPAPGPGTLALTGAALLLRRRRTA